MTTIRKFCCNDFLRFSSAHLDYFNITRELSVYLKWLFTWSKYCHVAVAPGNRIVGYILGADKQDDELAATRGDVSVGHWRGLVMTVSVASQYRRQKVATELLGLFQKQLVKKLDVSPSNDYYFIFIYVGVFNTPAQRFFSKMGYGISKTIKDFFSKNDEDAYEIIKEVVKEGQSHDGVRTVEQLTFA